MQNPAVAVDISSFSTKLQKLLDKANILAEFVGATIPAAKAVQLVAAINLWMARMFPVAVILGVVIAALTFFASFASPRHKHTFLGKKLRWREFSIVGKSLRSG
jgi:hypothetical protein